jgi:hypothetical protein
MFSLHPTSFSILVASPHLMSIAEPVGGINLRYRVSFEHNLQNHLQSETFSRNGGKVVARGVPQLA